MYKLTQVRVTFQVSVIKTSVGLFYLERSSVSFIGSLFPGFSWGPVQVFVLRCLLLRHTPKFQIAWLVSWLVN